MTEETPETTCACCGKTLGETNYSKINLSRPIMPMPKDGESQLLKIIGEAKLTLKMEEGRLCTLCATNYLLIVIREASNFLSINWSQTS